MANSETLQSSNDFAVRVGRWWFQNRSLSPVPLFLLMIFLPPDTRWSPGVLAAIVVGLLLSESIRVWAVGFAGSATRTRGTTVPELVHAGPYRYVRNPLYVANILLYTLCSLMFGFYWLTLFVFVYSCVQYAFIVRFEEELLHRSFGPSYGEYTLSVPRWAVGFFPRYRSSSHTFDLARGLRSERSTIYSMTAMTVLFVIKSLVLK